MQVENDYDKDVYNGDLGVMSGIDMEEGELSVDFDGREVTYGFGELDELVLAYATTIHKSQGSEYPAVVIPLSTQHYPMLHGGDARQTPGGVRGAAEGAGDRG
jgi:exodeoxyribonuclease V alpha subunit